MNFWQGVLPRNLEWMNLGPTEYLMPHNVDLHARFVRQEPRNEAEHGCKLYHADFKRGLLLGTELLD